MKVWERIVESGKWLSLPGPEDGGWEKQVHDNRAAPAVWTRSARMGWLRSTGCSGLHPRLSRKSVARHLGLKDIIREVYCVTRLAEHVSDSP